MLKVDNLRFAIGNHTILDGIHLQWQKGLLHAVIGPNGAGKSTLLKNICRIWKPTGGKVFLYSQDMQKMARQELSRQVTYVPSEIPIAFPMKVEEMVLLGRNPHSRRFQSLTTQDRNIAQKAMQEMDVAHLSERLITELSSGEKQRVWIACALTTESPWLFLDEPTSSLDIEHKLKIFHLLRSFKEKGLTVVASIHELHYAHLFFDTVSVLSEGKLYASGPVDKIMTSKTIREVFHVETAFGEIHGQTLLHFYI